MCEKTMSLVAVLCCSLGLGAEQEAPATTVSIRGCIRTADGTPVAGVEVKCFEIDPAYSYEFVWQRGSTVSDDQGRYAFSVQGGREYRIHAGGTKSTSARSEKFVVPKDRNTIVEDLIVVPATAVLKGRVVNADGSPAAGLACACMSERFQPYRPLDCPQAGPDGEFHLNTLPTEEVVFWVVVSEHQAQLWPGLSPDPNDRVFRLDPAKFVELPPRWKSLGDLEFLAEQTWATKVQERIDFTVPDLEGRPVSLGSERFRGKVVLVNLFGTWCGGCMVEAPHLARLRDKYAAQGLEVIGIAFEPEPQEAARAKLVEFIARHKINYPVLFGGLEKRAHVLETIRGIERFCGYPTTIFVGRDGTVRDVKVGFKGEGSERIDWQVRQFEQAIVRLLDEPFERL